MALSKEDILEAIAAMSVMDVVELIEAMEEKFMEIEINHKVKVDEVGKEF